MAATQESQRNAITLRNSREISTSYFYYHFFIFCPYLTCSIFVFSFFFRFLSLSLSLFRLFFLLEFLWDTSTSLTRLSTRAFWFQVIDILLSGSSELLVTTVPGDAVSRLADGIGSFGRVVGGYQKSGHLSILRWLPDPHLQSVHGLRGKRNEWRMKFTVGCTNWRRGTTWRAMCMPAWKIVSKNSATLRLYITFFMIVYYILCDCILYSFFWKSVSFSTISRTFTLKVV